MTSSRNSSHTHAAGEAPTAAASVPANAARRYEVALADLPLSCPTPAMSLWNSHPRVYLPLAQDGRADCPYCGAEYVLVERPVT